MSQATTLRSSLSLPLIMAPMFLVSTPAMALAACAEGVVGSFPALNQRTSAGLEEWLVIMTTQLAHLHALQPEKTVAPYAVNLIVHKTNPRLQEDLALCVQYKVPIVITSLGAVADIVDTVHSYGGLVFHDVTNVAHAKKAVAAGVDGLIAVSAGAGGHAGTLNPFALVNEIRNFFDGPLALAGSLASGRDILAAQAMGADFAYMGTRFIGTKESAAPEAYKQMLCDATAADIVYTDAVSGIPANFLRASLENSGIELHAAHAQGDALKSLNEETKAWKHIWSAGHGVGAIRDIPSVGALIERLKQQYHSAHSALCRL